MNWQAAVGALLAAVAATLPGIGAKKWMLSVKILLAVIGALLLFWATQINSRKTASEVSTKLEDMRARIDTALIVQPNSPAQSSLRSLRAEFAEWADQFESNRSARQIERQQALLKQRADEISASLPAREFLVTATDLLRGYIDAYSARSGARITYNFPPVPEDITRTAGVNAPPSDRENIWTGSVTFTPEVAWEIRFYQNPGYVLSITVNPGGRPGAYTWDGSFAAFLHASKNGWTWSAHADKSFRPNRKLEFEGRPLRDLEQDLPAVLQELIELQILNAS